MHERAGERDALLHALRELAQRLVAELDETREVLHLGDRVRQGLPAQAVGAREEVDVFVHGRVAAVGQRVGHVADAPVRDLGMVEDAHAVEQDVSAVGVVERREDAHRRGLAGAVRTDEADDLARAEGERNMVDGVDAAREGAHEIANLDLHSETPFP